MDKITPVRKRLITYLKRRDPKLTDKDLAVLLNDIKRFVNLTRRIYTEPQANVSYRDRKVGDKIEKDRIFNTNLEELSKVMNKNNPNPLNETLRKFHTEVTKNKNGK